jgi:hypothetical protein
LARGHERWRRRIEQLLAGRALLLLGACTPAPALVRLETARSPIRWCWRWCGGARPRQCGRAAALALEEAVVRFAGTLDPVAPDYFIGPSRVAIPAASRERRGTLHASVCPEGERVCRVVSLPVRLAASR